MEFCIHNYIAVTCPQCRGGAGAPFRQSAAPRRAAEAYIEGTVSSVVDMNEVLGPLVKRGLRMDRFRDWDHSLEDISSETFHKVSD